MTSFFKNSGAAFSQLDPGAVEAFRDEAEAFANAAAVAEANAVSAVASRAPLASPALTGTPTAPTASVGTNTTQIATTAFVLANTAIAAVVTATGATRSVPPSDKNKLVVRSNGGAAMTDTLPGSGSVHPANTSFTYYNADTQLLAIKVASGAWLDGIVGGIMYLGPGQSVIIVSDGSNYYTVNKPQYIRLGANTTVYVDQDSGNNANTGLGSATSAFASLNQGYAFALKCDVNGWILTVQIADSAGFYGTMAARGRVAGIRDGSSVVFRGNTTTPSNVTIRDPINGIAVTASMGAMFSLDGVAFRSLNTHGVVAVDSGTCVTVLGVDFQTCAGAHMYASGQGQILIRANYKFSGSADSHMTCVIAGYIDGESNYTISHSGSPGFSVFADSRYGGFIDHKGATFTAIGGSTVVGKRFNIDATSLIHTQSSGDPNYFPGTIAGTTDAGGFYD